jgi:hypothetical protein
MVLIISLAIIQLTDAYGESGTFSVLDYKIDYEIEGAKLITVDLDADFAALDVEIVSSDDGFIELIVPRGLIDSKFSETEDDIFYVIIDGTESHYLEIDSTDTDRTLMIPFFAGDELIEIFGTDVLTSPPVIVKPSAEIIDKKEVIDDTKPVVPDSEDFESNDKKVAGDTKPLQEKEGGGCLIATAAYGSEMAPQVQLLREIRDNVVMSTPSGTSFMNSFNQFYYSFSPIIADWERQNPIFKEATRLFITPMISTLSIMTMAEDSESHLLGLGISIIALNLGIYVATPAIAIWKIKKMNFRKRG